MVDPKSNEILADSDPTRAWATIPARIPISGELVQRDRIRSEKLKVLCSSTPQYYQLERKLGHARGETVLWVRVMIASRADPQHHQAGPEAERERGDASPWWARGLHHVSVLHDRLPPAGDAAPTARPDRQRANTNPRSRRRDKPPPTNFR